MFVGYTRQARRTSALSSQAVEGGIGFRIRIDVNMDMHGIPSFLTRLIVQNSRRTQALVHVLSNCLSTEY